MHTNKEEGEIKWKPNLKKGIEARQVLGRSFTLGRSTVLVHTHSSAIYTSPPPPAAHRMRSQWVFYFFSFSFLIRSASKRTRHLPRTDDTLRALIIIEMRKSAGLERWTCYSIRIEIGYSAANHLGGPPYCSLVELTGAGWMNSGDAAVVFVYISAPWSISRSIFSLSSSSSSSSPCTLHEWLLDENCFADGLTSGAASDDK